MNWSRIRAIVRKDLKEIRANKMAVLPMVMVPAILCVALPAAATALAMGADVAMINGAAFLEKILPAYPVPADIASTAERIVYVFLNFTFVPFFMLVPIMVTTVISANSVVGEKERQTLETLLYTPVTNREFLVAKELVALIPALGIAFASFAAFFATVNLISSLVGGYLMIRSLIWIPAMLLLVPAVSGLGLSFSLLVSLKSKSFMEAQQSAGLLVLPFILLVGVQISGLVILKTIYVVALAAILFTITYLLIARVGPRFHREQVIGTL